MDQRVMNHNTSASLNRFSDLSDVEAPPFSDDYYLWESFNITVGLDDSGDRPIDEVIPRRLTNQFNRLNDQRRYYAAKNGTRQNEIMEEL